MKFFITLTKKSLAIILAVTVMLIIMVGQAFSAQSNEIDGSTNALRVAYLKSLGLGINDSSVTSKKITIPEHFDEVYKQYNAIQKKAGFDLSKYKGESADVYTYALDAPDNYQVHLIVCEDIVIGGDVAAVELNGEMLPLNFIK